MTKGRYGDIRTLNPRRKPKRTVIIGYVVYAITDQGVPADAKRINSNDEKAAWAAARGFRALGYRTHIEPQTVSK